MIVVFSYAVLKSDTEMFAAKTKKDLLCPQVATSMVSIPESVVSGLN